MSLPNTAKGLFGLSCVAYSQQDFETAGELFAQAMSLTDSEDFVDELLAGSTTLQALSATLEPDGSDEDIDFQISAAASSLSMGMDNKFNRSLRKRHRSESFDELDDFDESDEDNGFDPETSDYSDESDESCNSDLASHSSFGKVKSPIRLG